MAIGTLAIERFASPSTARAARSRESSSRRATAALDERTVWCACARGAPRDRARALRTALVTARELELAGEDELAQIVEADLVVLHDPDAARLAEAVRERGAHVVLDGAAAAAGSPAVDAYLLAWGPAGVAAAIPATGLVAAKEFAGAEADRGLAWSCLLAQVLSADRGETVGGTFHPRPVVAPR
jgi:hypothetical protein